MQAAFLFAVILVLIAAAFAIPNGMVKGKTIDERDASVVAGAALALGLGGLNFAFAVWFLAIGDIDVAPLVHDRFALDEGLAAFALATDSRLLAEYLERHPKLRLVMTEQGCSWILETLRMFERQYDMPLFNYFHADLSLRPTEYFQRQCYIGASMLSRHRKLVKKARKNPGKLGKAGLRVMADWIFSARREETSSGRRR